MGRSPCCDASGLKRGPWTPEEDQKLLAYIQKHGHGNWRSLPEKAGLKRCGKSCRLRWINYLRPDIKRGKFSLQEQKTIIQLHALLGNRWSAIASYLPKRTDNEIKNHWNTHIKKRLTMMGIDPATHKPRVAALGSANGDPKKVSNLTHVAQWECARLEAEARLIRESSELRQNNQQPGLPGPLPTQRRNKIDSRLGASRCLDIVKAWQRIQLKTIVIDNVNGGDHGSNNIDSPTSTLNYFLRNARSSSTNMPSFHPNQVNDQGLFTTCQDMEFEARKAWNMGTCNIGDEDLIKGLSNLLCNSCESDSLVQSNVDNDGNNGSKDGVSEGDENKNYWDDVFSLFGCGP